MLLLVTWSASSMAFFHMEQVLLYESIFSSFMLDKSAILLILARRNALVLFEDTNERIAVEKPYTLGYILNGPFLCLQNFLGLFNPILVDVIDHIDSGL